MFTLFIVLSRANMFALFCVIFVERMCLRCFIGSFTSECVCTVLCYFFSPANVFSLFIILSRANMFSLFYVIFLEQLCSRYFMLLSRADMFTLFSGTLYM